MSTRVKYALTASNASPLEKYHGDSFGYQSFNLYTHNIKPEKTVEVTTGLVFDPAPGLVILALGELPSTQNRGVEIEQKFSPVGGELKYKVRNRSNDDMVLEPYAHLSRIVFLKSVGEEPDITDELDETIRGESGFGSSGV